VGGDKPKQLKRVRNRTGIHPADIVGPERPAKTGAVYHPPGADLLWENLEREQKLSPGPARTARFEQIGKGRTFDEFFARLIYHLVTKSQVDTISSEQIYNIEELGKAKGQTNRPFPIFASVIR
jgi:hypothetical protein